MKQTFFDWDLGRAWLMAAAATGINFTQVNAVLTTLILIGTLILTWRKALRRRKPDRMEDESEGPL